MAMGRDTPAWTWGRVRLHGLGQCGFHDRHRGKIREVVVETESGIKNEGGRGSGGERSGVRAAGKRWAPRYSAPAATRRTTRSARELPACTWKSWTATRDPKGL